MHSGPKYGNHPPSGVRLDVESSTADFSDGTTVIWTDRWNNTHTVTLNEKEQVTVVFPIPRGGSWIWYDDDMERTGFARNTTWVEATSSYSKGRLRVRSTGWYPESEKLDEGLLSEVLSKTKAVLADVKDIIATGAAVFGEVIAIGKTSGLIKDPHDEKSQGKST